MPLNPLGKIPTLVTDDGIIFNSPVICEYLDAEVRLTPLPAGERPRHWEVMTRVALAERHHRTRR